MKSFNKNSPATEFEKLIAELLADITKATNKFVHRHKHSPMALTTTQIAAINFLASVTKTSSECVEDISKQLDYIEAVRGDTNAVFDEVRLLAKSVTLN